MRHVKERCYSGNLRCLRFWQLERRIYSLGKVDRRPRASIGERTLDAFPVSMVERESQ